MPDEKNNSAVEAADRALFIERIFDAPRPLVFEAWTKKEHLQKWCAPHGFTIPSCDGDLRPGGTWHCDMVAPDGARLTVQGIYREIVPNERLVFTHGWVGDDGKVEHETVVTVRFADAEGGGTRMTFEQAAFRSVESRDGHNGGWSQGFERLDELLAEIQKGNKS